MKGKYEDFYSYETGEVSNSYKLDILLIYSMVIGMANLIQTLIPDELP